VVLVLGVEVIGATRPGMALVREFTSKGSLRLSKIQSRQKLRRDSEDQKLIIIHCMSRIRNLPQVFRNGRHVLGDCRWLHEQETFGGKVPFGQGTGPEEPKTIS